jgi:hypothetical protein
MCTKDYIRKVNSDDRSIALLRLLPSLSGSILRLPSLVLSNEALNELANGT